MNRKKLAIAGVIASVGIATAGGVGIASAASSSNSDSLVDKLATKFNLNRDEVKAVFDENRSERQAAMEQRQADRLQKLVDNGKLTAEQKSKIEAKLKELKSARESERTELESWAKSNNIDMKYLMGGRHDNDTDLQSAVDNKEITSDQKKLIEDKRTELENKRKTSREELKKWAEDNGIDMKYLMGGGPGGHGRDHGKPF